MTRPSNSVDCAPYSLLFRHLLEDGGRGTAERIAKRIGYSTTEVRHIASGKRGWLHRETAIEIDKLLETLSHRVDR